MPTSKPPLTPDPCPAKTRADLEWDRLLEALAARTSSTMGRDAALSLPFAETREEAYQLLAQAREAVATHAAGEPVPVGALPDVRDALARLAVGGALSPLELRGVTQLLLAARTLRRFLQARRATAPALFEACATDPSLDRVADEIAGCFEPDGTLSDRASPRLKELRGEYQSARSRILSRLDDLMARYGAVMQDSFVTEREGRYVLPVRSDSHERFPGIVHATSSSGSTLFLEPRAIIPMGNRLKVLEADVVREELAIYARLSSLLADELPSVQACALAVATADVRAATARLGADLELAFPVVTDEPLLALGNARHPLLALDGVAVIPSDLAVSSGRAVIVSGPNAGGKTVALKTMGLAALMLRAGLPIAASPESTLGLFDRVLTDVGDDQSLHKNLSTFSAHVKNLGAILEDTQPGALVLLDEVATGTDPREGEALAAGVLDSLCARGGAVAATTHYEGLKALALGDARFRNASVGFDLATMTPTFRLALDVPGSSSALAVARRYGLPETVLERARRFLSREESHEKGFDTFEATVKKLNDERAALDLARQAAEAREREAEAVRVLLEAERTQARERDQRLVSREAEALLASVRRAREDLRAAQARLRSKKLDEGQLREAERVLARVAGELSIGGELESLITKGDGVAREPVLRDSLRKGARVYVPRLRAEAEVLEILSDGGVRVAAGSLKLTVTAAELRAPEVAAAPVGGASGRRPVLRAHDSRRDAGAPSSAAPSAEPALQTRDNTCDLRGLRADDALAMAESFLDRSLSERRQVVFLLHGHGTGALRDVLRTSLRSSPYVSHFRAGGPQEGGDGVTVVWMV